MVNQNCYICNNTDFSRVDGVVVDQPQLPILRCNNCGLVFLESFDHIDDVYYEDGDMWMGADSHGEESIVSWRNESFNDDNRRMKFLKNEIIGKDVMDFGKAFLNSYIKVLSIFFSNLVIVIALTL